MKKDKKQKQNKNKTQRKQIKKIMSLILIDQIWFKCLMEH